MKKNKEENQKIKLNLIISSNVLKKNYENNKYISKKNPLN